MKFIRKPDDASKTLASVDWELKASKSWETHLHGNFEPSAYYYILRTAGPLLAAPTEAAGPIEHRGSHNPPPLTISNNIGNLRVNIVDNRRVQYWCLSIVCGQPAWVEVEAGREHPSRKGFVLSTARPYKPLWVQVASYKCRFYPSRRPRWVVLGSAAS
ncbi:hypothetical protein AURDEDRAFT_160998 [Auricularia subglabra TFB-10046 SS5]|nr:hypothetical protein AURDEDRAFT_160998 [Auricularia subglabra TFB-10046 SS5]